MWLPTNTHREINSSHLRAQLVKQMPCKDHRDHPPFLEYSRITGTIPSSWNIQGSLAPSYLLGIFKDHWYHPIFLEYSRITGTIQPSWNIQGSLGLSCLPTTQIQNFRQCITLNQRASEKLIQSWITHK